MVNMNIMQLLAATAVGYGLAYAVRGINTGDWSIPMTADAVMEGAQRGLPIAAVYVGGVIVGRNWGAAEEPDLDIDIDLAGLALDNTGENFPEFQALLVEWYDSTLSRDERIHLARSLVRLMDHYGISNLVAHTALTPSMARSLYDFASAHGYGGLALDNVG
jgi:hypothetical protein